MSDIIDFEQEQNRILLKKYTRQLRTARVLLFILTSFLLIGSISSFPLAEKNGSRMSMLVAEIQLGVSGVFLALTIVSYYRAFVCLLILTILCVLGYLSYSADAALVLIRGTGDVNYSPAMNILGFLVQTTICFFLIRGTDAARKYEKLGQNIKTSIQTGTC